MAKAPPPPIPPVQGSPNALRAQILATEHWSLLASRSTAQSEVLTRISILLTLVSAGLVSLAFVGQVSGFSEAFPMYAIVILGVIALIGVLTQIRVTNVGMEDLMYVVAMNRLRAAYLELDPGIKPYVMAGVHDDFEGIDRTYFFLGPNRGRWQFAGSTMAFIIVVNSALVGLLAAAVATSLGAGLGLAALTAAALALLYFGLSMGRGFGDFLRFKATYQPLSPTPPEEVAQPRRRPAT
jgi:hypothetical protein